MKLFNIQAIVSAWETSNHKSNNLADHIDLPIFGRVWLIDETHLKSQNRENVKCINFPNCLLETCSNSAIEKKKTNSNPHLVVIYNNNINSNTNFKKQNNK